ncbi:MAG: hypothetical protein AB1805_07145 [Nitrospirota bacterium]
MKKAFYIGAALGALLGAVVALSMDLLLGQSLGSGWSEAVANDLNRLFNTTFPHDHILVLFGVVVAIGIISAFGAFIGGVCSVMVARLFMMLAKEEEE